MTEQTQVRTIEELRAILADGQFHDFKMCLNHGLYSRKSLKLCKNGRLEVRDHVSIPSGRYWLTQDELFDEKQTLMGKAMTHGSFIHMGDGY